MILLLVILVCNGWNEWNGWSGLIRTRAHTHVFHFHPKFTHIHKHNLRPCEVSAKSDQHWSPNRLSFFIICSFVRCDEIVNTFSQKYPSPTCFFVLFFGLLVVFPPPHSQRRELIKCRLSLGCSRFGFCLTSFLFEQQRSYDVINKLLNGHGVRTFNSFSPFQYIIIYLHAIITIAIAI